MLNETDLCTDCMQVITNPICPDCFSRQVYQWMNEKKISEYKKGLIKKKLREFVAESEMAPSSTRCIICGQKRVSLCNYCFNLRVDSILKKNATPTVTENFNELFNSEIIHVHYIP